MLNSLKREMKKDGHLEKDAFSYNHSFLTDLNNCLHSDGEFVPILFGSQGVIHHGFLTLWHF